MDKSTIVCRCEDITLGDVEHAVELGAETFDDVKRLTRGGMGLCQGKTCRTVISQIIAQLKGEPVAAVPVPNFRMPLRPVTMGYLAKSQFGASAMFDLLAQASQKERQEK